MASGKAPQNGDSALRQLITEIIRHCPKKREQIAEELSLRVGQRITVHMLNAFTSDSNKWSRFPAVWLEAFSEIVGDDRLERYVISKRNRDVLEFGEIAITVLGDATREGLKALKSRRSQARQADSRQTALPIGEPD